MIENVDYFKFIIIGSSGVGKTCIMRRIVDDTFNSHTVSTTGIEFDTKELEIDDRKIPFQIWDTAGQERFRSISKAYFRNAIGVMLVFSLCDRQSFDDINGWLKDAHALCCQDAEIILIGNKSDEKDKRVVPLADAEGFAELHKLQYIETSALEGSNVNEAFIRLASDVVRKADKNTQSQSAGKLVLAPKDEKKGCC